MNPDLLAGATVVHWCEACNSERATTAIDLRINDEWVPLNIGDMCVARLKDSDVLSV